MKKVMFWGGVIVALIVIGALFGPGMVEPPQRAAAVPENLTSRAVIPGIPGARYFVALDLEPLVREALAARQRERDYLASSGVTGDLPPAEMLAISGGGDKGAFGAGLLYGWTQAGNRPTFKVVTGVSTGALIAPFAFLGSEYDEVLKEVYTRVTPTDIALPRSVIAAIQNDGMADNLPLWGLISKFVDQNLLDRIAEEHAKGRILLVGTTDLDARQPVIWNMGVIASSGAPQALELFRSILLASAAIPGAFPPTMVPVEVDGEAYQEMHVDGGASAQVFLYPPGLSRAATSIGEQMSRHGHVYVIRNSSLSATWAPVSRQTINIAGRAIDSLIHTQGLGDLFRIYLTTQQDGLDFNLAYIDKDFVYANKKEQFENAFMVKLFDYGYQLGRKGYPWHKTPPGIEVGSNRAREDAAAAPSVAQ
jgi:predicted acylesterase/phospholipase RssA